MKPMEKSYILYPNLADDEEVASSNLSGPSFFLL